MSRALVIIDVQANLFDEPRAYRIGLPCKSGVGGGIVAIVPDQLSLCVWSPALDSTGNSVLAMKALELFAAKTKLSIF